MDAEMLMKYIKVMSNYSLFCSQNLFVFKSIWIICIHWELKYHAKNIWDHKISQRIETVYLVNILKTLVELMAASEDFYYQAHLILW